MEKQARITSKGQITVPREVRRALGVHPGDRLLFRRDETGMRVRPIRTKSPFAGGTETGFSFRSLEPARS